MKRPLIRSACLLSGVALYVMATWYGEHQWATMAWLGGMLMAAALMD